MSANGSLRIIHFVSGGGSGATRVALDLALRQAALPEAQPHLVLREKGRPLPADLRRRIQDAGLPLHWVHNLHPRSRVVRQIESLCEQIRPVAFFAHGYSEHLWGRRAASRVPLIIHVEHNVERYAPWRVWAARRLVASTSATVCVSEAVERHVRELRIGARRTVTLHNGIDTERFHCEIPLALRAANILMPARFAQSKDQPTLIRAVSLLRERGWRGELLLAGGGKRLHRRNCERLVRELELGEQVSFLGAVEDLPARFAACRVVALSSRREGLPLVLAEAMSAGCSVVASEIPGITEIVRASGPNANGWLFRAGDPAAAAEVLWRALNDTPEAQRRVEAGHRDVDGHFSLDQMAQRYERLMNELLSDWPRETLPDFGALDVPAPHGS
jgi:glycosyltransferase involved in cell wall biosynthesis